MVAHIPVRRYINSVKMMCLVRIILSCCESVTLFVHTPTEVQKLEKGLTKIIKL